MIIKMKWIGGGVMKLNIFTIPRPSRVERGISQVRPMMVPIQNNFHVNEDIFFAAWRAITLRGIAAPMAKSIKKKLRYNISMMYPLEDMIFCLNNFIRYYLFTVGVYEEGFCVSSGFDHKIGTTSDKTNPLIN